MTARVEAAGLVRAFGARRAVDGLSFSLAPGDCLALFGPNGAGKTTALRLLAGLLSPTAGTASIEGVALPKPDARARVGLISHRGMLYEALTARENVRFSAQLHGLVDPDGATQRALEQLRVADRADVAVRALSRGLQQRVAIARAIVNDPKIIVADEPTGDLDRKSADDVLVLLDKLNKELGKTIFMVTHDPAAAERATTQRRLNKGVMA